MKNGNRYTVGEYLGEGMFGMVMEISNQKNEKFAAKMIKATKDKPEVLKIELDMMEKIAADPHESILQLIAV
uniref:Protein kinase domain-containing protein n=1 Tax=Caenorhabditis tropicalis TaxID=1561998 RepID=A0A1I7TI70_9PELO